MVFKDAINRAMESCKSAEIEVSDHFADAVKMVEIGSNAVRDVDDIMLTRYACSELVKEAIPYTFEVGNVNLKEIDSYMVGMGDIVFAEKSDRQMTGNINRMILDMSYQWKFAWKDDETIQAYEAWEQNRGLRKIGKDYIYPFEEMLKALCGIEG